MSFSGIWLEVFNQIQREQRLAKKIQREQMMESDRIFHILAKKIQREKRSVDLDRKDQRVGNQIKRKQRLAKKIQREQMLAKKIQREQMVGNQIQREKRSVDLDRKDQRVGNQIKRKQRSVNLNRKEQRLTKINEGMMQRDAILNADSREEKMTVEKQEVSLSNRRFCHGTKLLKSSLSLAPLFLPCAGGTGHRSDQPEHQGHSEIYSSTLNVVSNCPSLGEYMQRSFTKCADVCGSYMQDGNCAYHCMRDSSKTKLVEFCAKPKPLFDFCPEYDPVDQTIQKDLATLCNSTFSRNYYNSSDIYFCDPNNCLQVRESSVRSGATTLTTLMNETTEMNDGDSQELFVWLFVGLAALTLAIIIGYILHRVFVRLGIFSGRTGKMTKKRKQNGKQYVYTEKVITY